MSNTHKEVLGKLCRVCGGLLQRNKKHFEVKNYHKDLKTAFWITNLENDDCFTHPQKFCNGCYHRMKNITQKGHTHSMEIFKWEPHSEAVCEICLNDSAGKRGRKKAKKNNGWNVHMSENMFIWTREFTDRLRQSVPETKLSEDLNISDFDSAINPSLTLCKCLICENVLRRPVMIQECQHSFCLGCTTLTFEGKREFRCPYCQNKFNPDLLKECKVRNTLVESLILKCNCGQLFESSVKYRNHITYCQSKKEGHSLTINELLTMDLSENPLPKSVERATLRVLKHKMENSQDGTAELASGGPRVGFLNFEN